MTMMDILTASIWFCLLVSGVQASNNLDGIKHYEFVEPLHVNTKIRNKRDLSTGDENTKHFEETTFEINTPKRNFVVHLKKNSFLVPNFKMIHQDGDGKPIIQNKQNDCYYHGYIHGEKDSFVTMSTCRGLRGLLQSDNGDDYFIQPFQNKNGSSRHIMYNMKDVEPSKTFKCGHDHNHLNEIEEESSGNEDGINMLLQARQRRSRRRRSSSTDNVWTYVETIAVIDHRRYVALGKSLEDSQQRAVEMMNYVDMVYKTIQVRIALIGVIVWNIKDGSNVSVSAGTTLKNFKAYSTDVISGEMKIYHDNAQLISGIDFSGAVAGLGGVGSICSQGSVAVNQDHSSNPAVSANTVAHELGHNLGFHHFGSSCACANPPCVMSSYAAGTQVKGFTDCTIKTFNERVNASKYPCLYDLPEKLYTEKVCGNGYLEEGEQCDCGTEQDCKLAGADKCCNHTTCELHASAQCAIGACCNDCKFKSKGNLCRDYQHEECDLQEYCTGKTADCPRNVYIANGKPCNNDTGSFLGLCYSGLCKIHRDQCETLWGPNGERSPDPCFNANKDGSDYGNCGKDVNDNPIKCTDENKLCGKIQCTSKPGTSIPRWPLLGTNRGINIKYYGSFSCRTIRMDYPEELDDPTITFDGTKCGDNSVCMSNKCVNISSMPYQPSCNASKCQNGGVCNNMGNCHCAKGWACPFCQTPGDGGSEDSGQGCYIEVKGGESGGDEDLAYLALLILPVSLMVIVAVMHFKGYDFKRLFTLNQTKNGRIGSISSPPPPVQYNNNNGKINSNEESTMTNPYTT